MKGKFHIITFFAGFWSPDLQAQTDSLRSDSLRSDKLNKLSEFVVTGTKTFKRKTESPVMVNILDSKTLGNLQVCNLSEGLKFQPGLRVETDCQTCNYTQLRMNGLQGGYAQILINGRPIFSPLMGLYGMEQLPVNMIEKIEVVRGGGSSLYGSSAIGGTVNVITKLPKKNGYEINSFYQRVKGQTGDVNLGGNATLVNKNGKTGTTLFVNHRNRGFYDANADHLSELPQLKNTSLGLNSFIRTGKNQKLELSLSNLHEYRFGGDMSKQPAHLSLQAEERTHRIWMGSADYQLNFNEDQSSLITYAAFQRTGREHYTGIFPDSSADIEQHLKQPPYGQSLTTTLQGGLQLNHTLPRFPGKRQVITLGSELVSDKVFDEIPAYRYLVNQHTLDWGTFLQSDWELSSRFTLLSGLRLDIHNLLPRPLASPRVALLYKHPNNAQFRLSYGTGFRAPQAFDTDLHIAFAGGGVSRVQISPLLKAERSQSLSASVIYDRVSKRWIAGFTLEGFYTYLRDAFVLTHIGQDSFGEIFQKQNGQSAAVQGITLELRTNYNRIVQLESGLTLQQSAFSNPVAYIQGVTPQRTFLRTPADYGFATLSITPQGNWTINVNYVYTGRMQLAHFGGAQNFPQDQLLTSKAFSEVNTKLTYTLHLHSLHHELELYGGIKNMFDSYQSDFDEGKNRDSNYIYGPAAPRTVFLGLKLRSE